MRKLWRRVQFFLHRNDLTEELRVHQQMRADDGLGEHGFGNDLLLRERSRDAWGWLWLDSLQRDVRYALRMLRRAPGFALVAILSLAIGIGACTAVYSLADAVFLRPLPVAHPGRLFTVYWAAHRWRPNGSDSTAGFQLPDGRKANSTFSYPMWRQWQQDARSVLTLAGFQNLNRLDVGLPGGMAERVPGMMVSGNFDSVVGLTPALGRGINASDNRIGAPLVAEVSYEYWHARLDSRRDILGTTLLVNGLPAEIIGVAPRGFLGLLPERQPAIYLPLRALTAELGARAWGFNPSFSDPTEFCIEMIGRTRPGITGEQAQAALAVPFARALATMRQHPRAGFDKPEILVASARAGIDANFINLEPVFWMLGALVALLLLIALATLANLLIARTAARQTELALRAAIGAGRGALVRQMTTECLVLAILGGVVAIPVADWLQQALQTTQFALLPIRMSLSAIGVAAALAIMAGVVLGFTAAWRATRLPAIGLRELHASSLAGRRATKVLLGTEVAVCLLVLASAGLFLRTIHKLEAVNPGFDAQHLLLFDVAPGRDGYSGQRLSAFYTTLQARLRALPGVESASAMLVPLASGDESSATDFSVSSQNFRNQPDTYRETVAPQFFTTFRIPLVAGRGFTAADNTSSLNVAIINRALAAERFTGDPVGQKLYRQQRHAPPESFTIVGVVGNTSYENVQESPLPVLFLPLAQNLPRASAMHFVVRSPLSAAALMPRIRSLVASLDASLPVTGVETQQDLMAETYGPQQLLAYVCSGLGLLVLLLAALGLYGLMSYAVVRRAREIGIRMALGSTGAAIALLLSTDMLLIVSAGIAVGLALTLAAGQLLGSLMFQLSAHDPLTLSAAAAFLFAVAALAVAIPARRAARIDPVQALRQE